MVTNATSLSRSGLSDFIIQRVTAVIIALYALCIVGHFLTAPENTHASLVDFFSSTAMQLWSSLALLSTAAHAWIGMWTVGTDYIRPHYFGRHATAFRLTYQGVCALVLFIYVGWGLKLFWSL
jgi:succinate dehydrogenase / fumarate reductase membrane anchor subunit